MRNQELFEYIDQAFDVSPLESEMDEIKRICNKQLEAENEKLVRTIADRNAELTEVERENRELREFVKGFVKEWNETGTTGWEQADKAQELLKEKG